jgi:hypothetical protein
MNSPAVQPQRDADHEGIIQLHAAEYMALTTRVTYVDLFSATVWGLIVAFITIVANSWERIAARGVLVWTSVIAIQLMLIVISSFMQDHYAIVLYLETDLRRLVVESGIDLEFWSYEKFLAKRRTSAVSTPWEWTIPPLALVPIALALWSRWYRWHPWDCLGLIASALALPILILYSVNLIKMRGKWTRAVNDREKLSGPPDGTPLTPAPPSADKFQ